MKLSAPKQITWGIAVVIGLVGILAERGILPWQGGVAFWMVAIAFLLLVVATLLRGL